MRLPRMALATTVVILVGLWGPAAEPEQLNTGALQEQVPSTRTGEGLGRVVQGLPWWQTTDVSVRKLETWEKSEEKLLQSLPDSEYPLDWYLLGPIPAKSRSDYYRAYPPEENVDVTATVVIGEKQLAWQRPYRQKRGSGLDLGRLWSTRNAVAYLYREIIAEEATDTRFFLGFHSGCRLWLNGEEIFFSDTSGLGEPDRIELPVHLKAGVNRLLVKTFSWSSGWRFYFHVADANPRKARIKGHWLLAELFGEAPDKQLEGRLKAVRGLLDLRDDPALTVALELLERLSAAGPVSADLLESTREVLSRADEQARVKLEPEALAELGNARGRRGDVRGAQQVLGKLVRKYPKAEVSGEALWTLGEYYRREGRTLLALPYFERLVADFPEHRRLKAARSSLEWCRDVEEDRLRLRSGFSAARSLLWAERLEESGNIQDAVELYLTTLSRWSDELVRVESDRLLSVPLVVEAKLRRLWPKLSRSLQAEVAAREDQAFRRSVDQGDGRALARARRLHPLAPAGRDLLRQQAARLIEAGQLTRAAALLVTVLREYGLGEEQRAQVATELAFCARLSGNARILSTARHELSALKPTLTVTWGAEQVPLSQVSQWLDTPAPAKDQAPKLRQLGNPVHARLLPDVTGNDLLRPRWPTPKTPVPWRPVIADGSVYCYDQQVARAFTLEGRLLWRSWPYPRPVRAVRGRGFKGLPGYQPVVDGDRLYTVQLAANAELKASRMAVFAYDRRTGRVLWSTEEEPALAEYDVASPPVPAFDRLYLLAYGGQVLSDEVLVCLDPESGHVLSMTLLVSGNGMVKVFRDKRSTSEYDALSLLPPPVADERRLYVATQMGAVVAVDVIGEQVDWVREYPRTSLVSTDDTSMVNYICRGISAPVIAGGLLYVVPRDSGELLAIDRLSGELRWRRNEYEFSDLWNVVEAPGGPLVITSDVPGRVIAYAGETGEARWTWRPKEGETGRGLVLEDRIIVPTGRALYELDLATGSLRGRIRLEEPRHAVAALAWGSNTLVGASEEGLLFWGGGQMREGGLDETVVEPAGQPAPELQPASAEVELPNMTTWAAVAPVAGPGTEFRVLPAEGGEEVVTWDGRWLSLYALGRRPELRWRRALGGDVTTVRANTRVLVAASGHELVALERATGQQRWRWSIPVRAGGYWSFDSRSSTFRALEMNERMVVAGLYRSVWALDVENGEVLWRSSTEYDLLALSLAGDFVYAASLYYRGYLRLEALSAADGRPRADNEFRGLDGRNARPVVAGSRLWVFEKTRSRLTAYDLATATELWRESYAVLKNAEYSGQDDRHLFFDVRPPRGQPHHLLAIEKAAGARAYDVQSPNFQTTLLNLRGDNPLAPELAARPYLVLAARDLALEEGRFLVFQRGPELIAWPTYTEAPTGGQPGRRWALFADKEVLTSISRRGPYLFLATVQPVALLFPRPGELVPQSVSDSATLQPTFRVLRLPDGELLATRYVPPVALGIPTNALIATEHGVLHAGAGGLTFLAPVGAAQALRELRALRSSPELSQGERALLETLLAAAEPVALDAYPCNERVAITVDGDLSDWSAVPEVRFSHGELGWRRSIPGAPAPDEAAAINGSLKLAWDEDWLYLALRVDDDIHHPPAEAGAPWRSDAIIVGVITDVVTERTRRLNQFVVWGTAGQARQERLQRHGTLTTRAAVGRRPSQTSYELAIARSSLAQRRPWPPVGADLRLAFQLSDRDDRGLRELLSFPPGRQVGRYLENFASVTFLPAATE